MVSKRGVVAVVRVPVQKWRRLRASARPGLKQLLLMEEARTEVISPSRG